MRRPYFSLRLMSCTKAPLVPHQCLNTRRGYQHCQPSSLTLARSGSSSVSMWDHVSSTLSTSSAKNRKLFIPLCMVTTKCKHTMKSFILQACLHSNEVTSVHGLASRSQVPRDHLTIMRSFSLSPVGKLGSLQMFRACCDISFPSFS